MSGGRQLNFDPNIDANQLLVTGLEPNTTYMVMVNLGNRMGGRFSKVYTVTTPPGQYNMDESFEIL